MQSPDPKQACNSVASAPGDGAVLDFDSPARREACNSVASAPQQACNSVTSAPQDGAELNIHSPARRETCNSVASPASRDRKNLYTPDKRLAELDQRLGDEDIDDDEIALLDEMLNMELESDDDDDDGASEEGDENDPEGFDDLMGLLDDDDFDGDFDEDEIASQHPGDDDGDDDFNDFSDEFGSQEDALDISEPELAEESCSRWMAIGAHDIQVKLAKPGGASALRQRVQRALQQDGSGEATSDCDKACLKWEHALVFDDCPPLLGVSNKQHAHTLTERLSDLTVDFAWPREKSSPSEAKVTKKDIDVPASGRDFAWPRVTKKDIDAPALERVPITSARKDTDGSLKARSRSRDSPQSRRNNRQPRPILHTRLMTARSRSRGKPAFGQFKARTDWVPEKASNWRNKYATLPLKTDSDDHVPCDSGEAPNVAVDHNGALVIYKPAFWTVTTGQAAFENRSSKYPKLQDWLRSTLGWDYPFLNSNERSGLIHRLDVQTSGPILVGSNSSAFHHLRNSLHQHRFFKEYVALMHGAIPVRKSYGTMDFPLLTLKEGGGWRTVVDNRGEEAKTHYEAIGGYKAALGHGKTQRYTLVRLQLITGKTHQIRVHLLELARRLGLKIHGIVGDYKYLPKKNLIADTRLCRRVFLHCWRLHFPMPDTHDEELCKVRCNLPIELQTALKRLDLDSDLTAGYRKHNAYNNIMPREENGRADESVPGLREFSRSQT